MSGPVAGGQVRIAAPREADRLAALWTLLTDHHTAEGARFALGPGAEDEIRAHLVARIRDPQARVLVCEVGGDLSGLCIALLLQRSRLFRETERGEIEALIVRPDARRQGHGRALVDEAVAWVAAAGVARVEIQVARANAEGQAFWRALGYEPAMDVLERRL